MNSLQLSSKPGAETDVDKQLVLEVPVGILHTRADGRRVTPGGKSLLVCVLSSGRVKGQ